MITNTLLNANEFRYQSKLTPENLSKFTAKQSASNFLNFLKAFLSIFVSMLKGFRFLFYNSGLVFENQSSTDCRETIFLSHFFEGSPNFNNDTFFGEIPLRVSKSHSATIFYLSQNSSTMSVKYLKSDTFFGMQRLSIPFMRRVSIFTRNLLFVFETLLKSTRFSKGSKGESSFCVAAEQSNVRTLRNLLLTEIVLAQICPINTKHLWFILEGHPYERYLVFRIQRDFPNVKLFGYQHAPIVPAQIGLLEIISDFGGNLYICTSGSVTQNYLLNLYPDLSHNIIEIGSGKYLDSPAINVADSQPFSILFLPEGTSRAADSMFNFALQVNSSLPHLKIIFRTHPRTPIPTYIEIRERCTHTNIEFSERKLHEDLIDSSITVFRSSSAAIEGLLFGNLPIFLNIDLDENLDPLSISSLCYPKVIDVQSFREVIEGIISRSTQNTYSSQDHFASFALNYFTPLSIPWSQLRA
jgi:hypothetical protein